MYSFLFKCCALIYLAVTVNSMSIREVSLHEDFLDERYYNTTEIAHLLNKIENQHPTLAKVHEIGVSSLGQSILVIEITSNVGKSRRILKPMFKYIANMHGDETVGLQLLLYLAQYLTSFYGIDDRITKIVDSTDIYLMPTLNPDGYSVSRVRPFCFISLMKAISYTINCLIIKHICLFIYVRKASAFL